MARGASHADESELVVAARAGQAWALTEIWQRWAPSVTGYLRGRGADDADDLTSEVFINVFERIRRFHGDDDDLRAFVFTVAHHRLVDQLRARQRRGVAPAYDANDDPRTSASAEEDALTNMSTASARALLDALSPNQREVILLRIFGELSLEQTAAALGKRVGAVKALQHRGLAGLRKILGQAVSL